MNCEQARRVMQDILNGTQMDYAELDAHCAQCPQCRAEWCQLQAIDSAVRADTQCDVSVASRDRVMAGALRRIEFESADTARGARWLRRVATAALLVAIFATGLYAGRTVWPHEVIVTETVKVPEVREKIVKVPVFKEKVVIKRVPVVKERIVYRDREVEKPVPVVTPAESPEPVKLDEFISYVASNPVPPAVQVREEIKPTTVIGEAESREASPIEGHREQPDSTITEAAAETVIAQNIAH